MNNKQTSVPLVSVITVCLNSERTLQRCIDSVANQTYKNIQHIIIDGMSGDRTAQIVEQNRSKISVFISEKDNGIADALNKGLKVAQGEYIQILNSDDYLPPGKIGTGVEILRHMPNVAFVHGDVVIVNAQGQTLFMIIGDDKYYRKVMYFMPRLNHPTLLTKKALYDQYGGFDNKWKIAMDYAWLRKVTAYGAIGQYSKDNVVYMQDGGASRQSLRKVFLEEKSISIESGDSVFLTTLIFCLRLARYYTRRLLERIIPPRFLLVFRPGKKYDIKIN